MAEFPQRTPTPPALQQSQIPQEGPAPGVQYDPAALMAWYKANPGARPTLNVPPGPGSVQSSPGPLPPLGTPSLGGPQPLPPVQAASDPFSQAMQRSVPNLPSPIPPGANLGALFSPMQTSAAPAMLSQPVITNGSSSSSFGSYGSLGDFRGGRAPLMISNESRPNPEYQGPVSAAMANASQAYNNLLGTQIQGAGQANQRELGLAGLGVQARHAGIAQEHADTERQRLEWERSPEAFRRGALSATLMNPNGGGLPAAIGLNQQLPLIGLGGTPGAPQAGGAPQPSAPGAPGLDAATRLAVLNPSLASKLQGMPKTDPGMLANMFKDSLSPDQLRQNAGLLKDYLNENIPGGAASVTQSVHVSPGGQAFMGLPSLLGSLQPWANNNIYSQQGRRNLGQLMTMPVGERFDRLSHPSASSTGNAMLRELGY